MVQLYNGAHFDKFLWSQCKNSTKGALLKYSKKQDFRDFWLVWDCHVQFWWRLRLFCLHRMEVHQKLCFMSQFEVKIPQIQLTRAFWKSLKMPKEGEKRVFFRPVANLTKTRQRAQNQPKVSLFGWLTGIIASKVLVNCLGQNLHLWTPIFKKHYFFDIQIYITPEKIRLEQSIARCQEDFWEYIHTSAG